MTGTLQRMVPHDVKMHAQEYRRQYHLEPLVKVLKQEDKILEQQGRARATVRGTCALDLLSTVMRLVVCDYLIVLTILTL